MHCLDIGARGFQVIADSLHDPVQCKSKVVKLCRTGWLVLMIFVRTRVLIRIGAFWLTCSALGWIRALLNIVTSGFQAGLNSVRDLGECKSKVVKLCWRTLAFVGPGM